MRRNEFKNVGVGASFVEIVGRQHKLGEDYIDFMLLERYQEKYKNRDKEEKTGFKSSEVRKNPKPMIINIIGLRMKRKKKEN